MQRSLHRRLCFFFALVLSASLLPIDDVYARGRGGGGGGGGRGGGGGGRGASVSRSSGSRGGGASPRVNKSVSTQNRGNFNNRSQANTRSRQAGSTQRQGQRQTTRQSGQGERTQRQGERQDTRQDLAGERTERQGTRQGERTQRQGTRQQQTTQRQNNRQDFVGDNYYGGGWYGGGWYGGGYGVPPGWGWAALATGLVIGAAVNDPPPYYDTVYVGSTSYIYSDGVYMQPSGSTYTVVAPPTGAVVTYLPDGCTETQMSGMSYYDCSGIYYQAVFQNGSTVYQVVQR